MKRLHAQQGLTLVELMVTLAISGVIMAGIVNIYVGSLSQSRLTSNLASMQESGRFALELLARDIRMAGFTGCLAYDRLDEQDESRKSFWGLYTRGGVDFNEQAMRGIQGWEASGTGLGETVALVTESTSRTGTGGGSWVTSADNVLTEDYAEAIDNSDILRVWTAGELAVDITTVTTTANSATLTVPSGTAFSAGDLILFSRCGIRMLAQVCAVSGNQLSINAGSSGTCNNTFPSGLTLNESVEGAEAFNYRDVTYFVGKRDDGALTPPSLYRASGNVAREMVEGVESLQILYGVDSNREQSEKRSADVYVTADDVGDRWNEVVSVRISVLMRSFERTASGGTQEFNFNGVTHSADDGYVRQVYSTTITLRNRAVGTVDNLF